MTAIAFPQIFIPRWKPVTWGLWHEWMAHFTEGRVQRRPASGKVKRSATGRLKRNSSTSSTCCCPNCGNCPQVPSSVSVVVSGQVVDSGCCNGTQCTGINETLLLTPVGGVQSSTQTCVWEAASSWVHREYEFDNCTGSFVDTGTSDVWSLSVAYSTVLSQASWVLQGPNFASNSGPFVGVSDSANCMTGLTLANGLDNEPELTCAESSRGCEVWGGSAVVTPIA